MNEDILVAPDQLALEQKRFIVKVYGWMAAALAITGLVAMYVASSPSLLQMIFGNQLLLIGLVIVELLLVVAISGLINKLSSTFATALFILYSAINGLTISWIFIFYTAGSISSTFFITAGLFAVMSAYGYFTGKDLTNFGSLLFMLLIGLVIASVVNIFLHSTALYWISTYVGIFIFTGLIAYDTQKLKTLAGNLAEGTEEHRKGAIIGALSLYLDFINLFLMLLRIFGNRRD